MDDSSLKQIIAWTTVIILMVIVVVMKQFNMDENLKPEVAEHIAGLTQYQSNLQQHPEFLLKGFDAKANIDPLLVGKLRYTANQLAYEEDANKTLINRIFELEPKLVLANVKSEYFHLYAQFSDSGDQLFRLDDINKNKAKIQAILKQNKFLIDRYQTYLAQDQQAFLYERYTHFGEKRIDALQYARLLYTLDLLLSQQTLDEKLKSIQAYYLQLNQRLETHKNAQIAHLEQRHMLLLVDVMHHLSKNNPKKMVLPQLTKAQLSAQSTLDQTLVSFNDIFSIYRNQQGTEEEELVLLNPDESINDLFAALIKFQEIAVRDYQSYQSIDLEKLVTAVYNKPSVTNAQGQMYVVGGVKALLNEIVDRRLLDDKIRLFNLLQQSKNIDVAKLNQNKQGYVYFIDKSLVINGKNHSFDALCIRDRHVPKRYSGNPDREISCLEIL